MIREERAAGMMAQRVHGRAAMSKKTPQPAPEQEKLSSPLVPLLWLLLPLLGLILYGALSGGS